VDLNLVCLEGVISRETIRIGGGEWSFRVKVEGQEIRVRCRYPWGCLVGDRVWVAGKVIDGMLMRIEAEEVRFLREPVPTSA
jgi:hypothetical protein